MEDEIPKKTPDPFYADYLKRRRTCRARSAVFASVGWDKPATAGDGPPVFGLAFGGPARAALAGPTLRDLSQGVVGFVGMEQAAAGSEIFQADFIEVAGAQLGERERDALCVSGDVGGGDFFVAAVEVGA